MSSGIALDLPTETDLIKFTQWVAKKWRPLWSWYATREEALAIAASAIFESTQTWNPKGRANKRTWAINTARLKYLNNHGHEERMRKCGMMVGSGVEAYDAIANPIDMDYGMDVESMLNVAKSIVGERHYNIMADASRMTRREAAKKHGIGMSRLCEIGWTSRAKARKALKSILAKNKCTSINELY